jgi:hypothetical protein
MLAFSAKKFKNNLIKVWAIFFLKTRLQMFFRFEKSFFFLKVGAVFCQLAISDRPVGPVQQRSALF